jgi:hypothetical protein
MESVGQMAADAPQRASATPPGPDNNGVMAAEFHPTYRTAPQAGAERYAGRFPAIVWAKPE